MDQLIFCATIMILFVVFVIPWRRLSLADFEDPPWLQNRKRSRIRKQPDTPDLVVPPGKRSKSLNHALKRVQQAAPDAVHREQGGARRYALVPRIRQEISAVLEDSALADSEALELRRAFEAKCTYILGTHSPVTNQRVSLLGVALLKLAAATIPDGTRWREEWMAEYLAMAHYPIYARSRFLVGLFIAAPRLSRELRRSKSIRNTR